jgi:hypothetical protein
MERQCGKSLNVIGYSGVGCYFAFEQYGVQDGSGFAHADIFVTNLAGNTWVKGSPFQIGAKSKEPTAPAICKQVAAAAAKILEERDITGPADILVSNPVMEILADRKSVVFDAVYHGFAGRPAPFGMPAEGRYDLKLITLHFAAGNGCPTEDGKVAGYALLIRNTFASAFSRAYRVKSAPTSRLYSIDYEIEAIASVPNGLERATFAEIIAH